MSEWWTYAAGDFLLFSPRVYWRMFALHNAAVWPLQIPALLLGVVLVAWVVRPRPWSDRGVSVVLAAAWAWVAWSFLWNRYAAINWAVAYAVPIFAAQALLLLSVGGMAGRLRFAFGRTVPGLIGLVLLVYAVVLHPLVPPLAGRSPSGVEVFGVAPDPTVVATLGLGALAAGSAMPWLLFAPAAAWGLFSGATLLVMGAAEGWIPLVAVALAAVARLWPPAGGRPRPPS